MSAADLEPVAVTVRVPAKINLQLLVGPRRPDGYHSLSTVYQAVGIYDEVTVSGSPRWECSVESPGGVGRPDVPTDTSNLAVQAAQLLASEMGVDAPVHLSIVKSIPVAGGMAGGSADAAATLVACDRYWDLGLSTEQLQGYAARLGSDVPFLIGGGTAVGSGRGEKVAQVLTRGRYHWVFAFSDEGLATPAVYAECDRLRMQHGPANIPEPTPRPDLMSALRLGEARTLAESLSNDLQAAAISLRPELGQILDAGLEFGAVGAMVSGSGPTVAFLVENVESAIDVAVALTASEVAHEVRKATGPVQGAHVVQTRMG